MRNFDSKGRFKARAQKGGRKLNKRQTQQVKSIVNRRGERKHYLTNVSASNIDTSGTSWDLTPMSAGTTSSTRVGDDVKPIKVEVTLNFKSADTTNQMRILILHWKEDSGSSALALGDIFAQNGTSPPMNLLNYVKRKSYKVVSDRLVVMGDVSTDNVTLRYSISEKSLLDKITFDTGATTGTNKLYLVAMSDSGAATHPVIEGFVRVFYTDV